MYTNATCKCKSKCAKWTKQQCYYGAGEPEQRDTKINKAHCSLKYILKLSLLTLHAPATHRNALVRANRDLTATGTPTLPATAERAESRCRTLAHRCLIAKAAFTSTTQLNSTLFIKHFKQPQLGQSAVHK